MLKEPVMAFTDIGHYD